MPICPFALPNRRLRRLQQGAQRLLPAALCAALLSACGSAPTRSHYPRSSAVPAVSAPRGASLDTDGPAANPPPDLLKVPDARPQLEPIRPGGANKPYAVAGRWYEPITDERHYTERGLGSWYGRKYHGRPTASGEPYDMFAMTAAHPRLPIPSYARVRNPANGREVVVRINDRGPFVRGYAIDLSYTAALKLGLLRGVAPVEVERITPAMIRAGDFGTAEITPASTDLAGTAAPAATTEDVIGQWLLKQEAPAAGTPDEPAPQR
jgi:rare lipoprotein A